MSGIGGDLTANCGAPLGGSTAQEPVGAIAAQFLKIVNRHPNRVALICGGVKLTFLELSVSALSIAKKLRELSVEPGRPTGLMCEGSPQLFVSAYLGCLLAGNAVFLMDSTWSGSSLADVVSSTRCGLIIRDPRLVDELDGSLRGLGYRDLMSCTCADQPFAIGSLSIAVPPSSKRGPLDGTNPGVIFATSGVGGTPKLVMHTQTGLVEAVAVIGEGLGMLARPRLRDLKRLVRVLRSHVLGLVRSIFRPRVWLSPLPLSRIGGHLLMLQALLCGETFATPLTVKSGELLAIAKSSKATVIALSPIGAEMFIRAVERTSTRLPYLLAVGIGSDYVPFELVSRVESTLQCLVTVGYGSTETGGGVTVTNPLVSDGNAARCVGLPFRGLGFRVVDETGCDCPLGTPGRVVCLIPRSRMGQILNAASEDEPADPSRPFSGLVTGDIGWQDESGRLFITGRADDVIVRGGNNIDPVEIELACAEHPSIREAAAVGVRSKREINEIIAFVVVEQGGELPGDLIEFIAAKVERLKVPRKIVAIEALPRTSEGKILRGQLRLVAAEHI